MSLVIEFDCANIAADALCLTCADAKLAVSFA